MTRAQALIALDAVGHEGNERVVAAVTRSYSVLDANLAKCVENLIASAHVSSAHVGGAPLTRTRGNPRMAKYAWER